ncbi:YkoP family protein [Neobacillus mesonae]|uniref:YkoP family protein n=1 Tax=Neobacillus mesonae TaxID=1193713 RepID=UPI00203EB091|nr:hypothetical protein [Neobacillus mesonae]MCM3568944.1 hypothetical protein [Neobacillus mesonae]
MTIRLAIIWLWKLLDPIFYLCSRLHYINDEKNNRSIFRVRLTRYKGKPIVLSDGTEIERNDLLLKIHLHNVRLLFESLKIKNDLKKSRHTYKLVFHSMPALTSYLRDHPQEAKIKAVIGITTLNRGVQSLGFECFSPNSFWYCFLKKLGQLPIFLLSGTSLKYFQKHQLNLFIFIQANSLRKIWAKVWK